MFLHNYLKMAQKYFIDLHGNFYKFMIDTNKIDLKIKKISQYTFHNESKYTNDDIKKIIANDDGSGQVNDYIMWGNIPIDYKLYNLIIYLNQNNFITTACDQGNYINNRAGYILFRDNLINNESALDRLKKLLDGIQFKLNEKYEFIPISPKCNKKNLHDYYNTDMIFIDHLFNQNKDHFTIRFNPRMIQIICDKLGVSQPDCDLKILGNVVIGDCVLHRLNISNIINLQIDEEITKTLDNIYWASWFIYVIMEYPQKL